MSSINVPTREEVTPANQEIFDNLTKAIGFLPNIYAVFAHNDSALGDYLGYQNRKTSLNGKEKEVINLVVSQNNQCVYCLAAHTAIAGMNGFATEEIIKIRQGNVDFDAKLAALAAFVASASANKSKASEESIQALLAAGYSKANLIDIIIVIGDITTSNYLHGTTKVPVDFPLAPDLEA